MRTKNELSRLHLNEQRQENRSDIVIRAKNGHLIYAVDFLDTNRQILNGVQIIEQDSEGRIIYVIRAPQAIWTSAHDQEGGYWNLITPVIYEWEDDLLRFRNYGETNEFREEPAMFLRNMVEVEELRVGDARLLIEDLKATGLPFVRTLANYYRRYSFASVSLVVVVLSISMGGRFKKNILLMSLLSSLVAAVVFYVTEMITMLLAQSGYIYPIIGAWFPVFVFIALGLLCLKTAKT
jgi:lipopolysaccharide export system permease protein